MQNSNDVQEPTYRGLFRDSNDVQEPTFRGLFKYNNERIESDNIPLWKEDKSFKKVKKVQDSSDVKNTKRLISKLLQFVFYSEPSSAVKQIIQSLNVINQLKEDDLSKIFSPRTIDFFSINHFYLRQKR